MRNVTGTPPLKRPVELVALELQDEAQHCEALHRVIAEEYDRDGSVDPSIALLQSKKLYAVVGLVAELVELVAPAKLEDLPF